MDGITVAKSVFVDGQWTDAQWDVACVDGGTGELIITAIVAGRDAPVVTALRMDMETARHLRTMAGFSGTPAAEPYDCRTTGERLNALEAEQRLASRALHAALNNEIERRLAALEAAATPAIANREWMTATEWVLNQIEARLVALEAAGPAVADGRWMAEIGRRLAALEAAATPAIANREWMTATEWVLNQIEARLVALEAAGPAVADGRWMAEIERRLDRQETQPPSAIDALRQIANIQARDPDGLKDTWAELALACIGIAEKALEVHDGTRSNS